MRLYLPELLLLFCFARGVTSKELQDMPCWNSGKRFLGKTLAQQKISQRTQSVPENESRYALAITNATTADKRVLRKLTESLFSIPRRCTDAPR
jgi:hypothetical protein